MPDAFDAEPVLRVDAPPWFRAAIDTPFEQRAVIVDDCPINYLAWGDAEESAGGGIVFVHGGAAHAHWWTHVAATFAPWTRCAAIDLSGHGDSGRRKTYSLETWTDEVVAVAIDAGITRPIIVGHSMGGFVTLATAAIHADVPAGIVIVDSPVFDTDAEVEEARAANTDEPAAPRTHPDLEPVLQRFRTIPPQERYLDFVMDHVARRSLRQVDGGWQWKFDTNFWRAMGTSPRTSAVQYLDGVSCRVALFRCEEGLVDLDIGRFMFDRLGRNFPIIELPTAGHHPMLDTPLILVTALRTLLADWIHSDPHEAVH